MGGEKDAEGKTSPFKPKQKHHLQEAFPENPSLTWLLVL